MEKNSDILCKYNRVELTKIDSELGLVFGFVIICTEKGEPYYDLQGDHIPEDVMLKASTEFMLHSRVAKEMHKGEPVGSTVFAFPLTSDIAKSMGIKTDRTGLIIAMKPNVETFNKFKDGSLTGFSIGGYKYTDTLNED